MAHIEYRVDLDERGEFHATVYRNDEVLLSLDTDDHAWMMEVWGVRNPRDRRQMRDYFEHTGVLEAGDVFEIRG